ncbi:MAG: hypothetical protein II630_09125 [Bacteroidales bacterium]|nr:hypothetical protein [Bacteroidales bacterium]
MLTLTLEDAVEVTKSIVAEGMDDEEIIRQELEQKCWLPPKPDEAAKRLNGLIFDINPAEICSQIKSDNLSGWCKTIQTEMKMAMVQLPCWAKWEGE